jgi:hypothetical protein
MAVKTGVKTARLADIRDAWAERLGVEPEHVEGELEARFGALVGVLTGGEDDLGTADSDRAAVLYTDLYTIGAFVTDARRRLVRDEIDGVRR